MPPPIFLKRVSKKKCILPPNIQSCPPPPPRNLKVAPRSPHLVHIIFPLPQPSLVLFHLMPCCPKQGGGGGLKSLLACLILTVSGRT